MSLNYPRAIQAKPCPRKRKIRSPPVKMKQDWICQRWHRYSTTWNEYDSMAQNYGPNIFGRWTSINIHQLKGSRPLPPTPDSLQWWSLMSQQDAGGDTLIWREALETNCISAHFRSVLSWPLPFFTSLHKAIQNMSWQHAHMHSVPNVAFCPCKNKVSVSVCLAVRPSVCLPACLSVCLPVCLSVCCLGKASGGVWWVWRLAARSAVPNVAFCPCKNKVSVSVCPSVRPSVCLSACLSVCLSVCCLGKASGGVWWVWRLAARSAVPNVAFCPCKNKVSVSVCLAVRPSVRPSVCLPACLSVCLLPWKGQRGGLMGLKAGCQVGRA